MGTVNTNPSTTSPAGVTATTAGPSAVAWGAILAGATACASLSLILYTLGIGMGLLSVAPFSPGGLSAQSFGIAAILWVTLISLASSALGGYIAGRLRAKWVAVHSDEAFFRDTAHGFLAWSIAILITAWLVIAMATAAVNRTVAAGSAVVSGASSAAGSAMETAGSFLSSGEDEASLNYYVDSLFRQSDEAGQAGNNQGQGQNQEQV